MVCHQGHIVRPDTLTHCEFRHGSLRSTVVPVLTIIAFHCGAEICPLCLPNDVIVHQDNCRELLGRKVALHFCKGMPYSVNSVDIESP